MLANVWPEVLKYLLKRTGLKKNQEFAEAAKITEKNVSRYATRRHSVGNKNFDKIASGGKLTPGQLGYLYASFLLKYYRPYRFDLGQHFESEIKEPTATYDPPTARERAETLMRLDPLQVPPHLTAPLSLMRNEIKEMLNQHDSEAKKMESHLLRLVEIYEQMFEGSMDVWKEMKSLRGE